MSLWGDRAGKRARGPVWLDCGYFVGSLFFYPNTREREKEIVRNGVIVLLDYFLLLRGTEFIEARLIFVVRISNFFFLVFLLCTKPRPTTTKNLLLDPSIFIPCEGSPEFQMSHRHRHLSATAKPDPCQDTGQIHGQLLWTICGLVPAHLPQSVALGPRNAVCGEEVRNHMWKLSHLPRLGLKRNIFLQYFCGFQRNQNCHHMRAPALEEPGRQWWAGRMRVLFFLWDRIF